jgi:hypothetical protein
MSAMSDTGRGAIVFATDRTAGRDDDIASRADEKNSRQNVKQITRAAALFLQGCNAAR